MQLSQPEHGFCQQNARKNVTKYWYSSEKMVVFPPFCYLVDFVLQDAWILHRIKKDESDESLPVQLFEDMLSTQFF